MSSRKSLCSPLRQGKNWPASVGNIIKSLRLNPFCLQCIRPLMAPAFGVFFFLCTVELRTTDPRGRREKYYRQEDRVLPNPMLGRDYRKAEKRLSCGLLWGRKRNSEFECKCRVIQRCDYSFYWEGFLIERKISIFALTIHTYTHIITTITIATTKSSSLA